MTPMPFSTLSVPRRPLHRSHRFEVVTREGADRGDHLSQEQASRDTRYLRRWLGHQAQLYNELLQTIACIPQPH